MRRKNNFKLLLILDVLLFLIFIIYKCYLTFFEADFHSNNITNIKKLESINKDDGISFVVLGNIKSSIDIFDKQIVKRLNDDRELDYVISNGNAVINGSEDKYRILNKSLSKVLVPSIVGIGDKEITNHGSENFYKHYGPFYFSYSIDNAYFLFLDTTGETSEAWQQEWILKELKNTDKYKYKFVFMNKSPFPSKVNSSSDSDDSNIMSIKYCDFLTDTFSQYNVTAVFSSDAQVFHNDNIKNVPYFISGGAGGALLVNNVNSFYHYIKVNIKSDALTYSVVKQDMPSKLPIYQIYKNVWFYLHSIFYINFFNFILLLSIFVLLGLIFYSIISKEVDYYREFDELSEDIKDKQVLNIAMFTNNYFPFIGGVPISITRLAKGLRDRGHNVFIFAPKYPQTTIDNETSIMRCKLIIFYRSKPFDFPIANIFSPNIEKEFVSHAFDVVHVHHPFWMGSKGLELARKYSLPVILTYHTRLEKYAHYLPFFHITFENVVSHKIIKIFAQKCDAILAPTNSAREYLSNIGVSRDKYVLPTGVDFDNYINLDLKQVSELHKKLSPHNEVVLCSVSRLTKEKNIYFLLKAIKYLKQITAVPFKLFIIGDGPEKDNLQAVIKKEALEDIIELVGSVNPAEVCQYYLSSNIFIFSSQSETQGMVLLEAMAGRCPVVAIRSSGVDDVIINEYNGYKTKADIALWSEKVKYLIENPQKLIEMSKNAYDFSNKFSIDAMAKATEEVYYNAISHVKSHSKSTNSKISLEVTENEQTIKGDYL